MSWLLFILRFFFERWWLMQKQVHRALLTFRGLKHFLRLPKTNNLVYFSANSSMLIQTSMVLSILMIPLMISTFIHSCSDTSYDFQFYFLTAIQNMTTTTRTTFHLAILQTLISISSISDLMTTLFRYRLSLPA